MEDGSAQITGYEGTPGCNLEIPGEIDGYTVVETSRLHSMAQRYNAGSQFGELLIANYDINERRKNEPVQLSLFGDDAYERDYLQDYRYKRPNNHTFYISQGLKDYR